MLSHEEMIDLQAEQHWMVKIDKFDSIQDYVLHLIGKSSYEQASKFAGDKRVLDIGCNTGFGTAMLAKTAQIVVGVDVSEKALSIASKTYQQTNLSFQKIDGVSLPFPDNHFDLIISFQVIEHVVNYDTYINEICRVLKPKGVVIFTTPNSQIRLDPGMRPWNKFHVREFTDLELMYLLKSYFTHVKIMGLFAQEPINSIEYHRLQRALEIARKNTNDPFRVFIKKVVPENVIIQIKSLLRRVMPKKEKEEEIDRFIKKYGIETIHYLPDGLEKALDYFAICSNDSNSLDKTWRSLPNS